MDERIEKAIKDLTLIKDTNSDIVCRGICKDTITLLKELDAKIKEYEDIVINDKEAEI